MTIRRFAAATRLMLAASAALMLAFAPATPAWAMAVFIEANPNTIEAGGSVSLRASCDDNSAPATAESEAFGTVTLQPQFGFLTGAVTVPADRAAEDYVVRLRCPDGASATVTLHVLSRNRPSRGPATGFGGTAGFDPTNLLIVGGLAAIVVAAVLAVTGLRRRGAG